MAYEYRIITEELQDVVCLHVAPNENQYRQGLAGGFQDLPHKIFVRTNYLKISSHTVHRKHLRCTPHAQCILMIKTTIFGIGETD